MVYIDIIIPLLSLSLCLSMTTAPQCCLPSLLAGISRLCVYAILCCRKHLYRLKCEHLFRPSPAGWQLVLYLQGWDIFSYVRCLSPGSAVSHCLTARMRGPGELYCSICVGCCSQSSLLLLPLFSLGTQFSLWTGVTEVSSVALWGQVGEWWHQLSPVSLRIQ